MSISAVRRAAGVVAVTIATMAALALPASANNQDWRAESGGLTRATAHFDDAANRVYVTDTRADGTAAGGLAARMDIWRVGNKGGTHVFCSVGSTQSTNCPLIWVEDTYLAGQLCWYQATSEDCSATKEFYS